MSQENDLFEKNIKKEMKKAAAVGAVAVTVLGTGLAREAVEDDTEKRQAREADSAAVRIVDTDASGVIDLTDKTEKEDSVVEKIKENKIVSRFCTGVFLISWALIKMLGKLLAVFSSPIIHFVLLFAGILAAILLGVKTKYPEIPLKKVLSKKTLSRTAIFTGIVFAASTVIEFIDPDISRYVHIGELILGAGFSLFIIINVKPKKKKEKPETVTIIDLPDGGKIQM